MSVQRHYPAALPSGKEHYLAVQAEAGCLKANKDLLTKMNSALSGIEPRLSSYFTEEAVRSTDVAACLFH